MDTADTVMIALLFVQDSERIETNDDGGWSNQVIGKIPSEIGKASRLEIINLCKWFLIPQ